MGLSLYYNYKKIGTTGSLNFKKAILNIWLSNKPVDKSLKPELLDGATEFLKN
ncbi:chalcone isomerase family protein [Aquimarina agarivorans]|uniref:chalcone isomerase family protein n=1 Tax=Aquimarina agarivorans TaxID=980584 RepID=UPI000B9B5D09